MSFGAASETGKVREHNEDRWFADPIMGLYIVADGMGGASNGEVAAQYVIDHLPEYVETFAGDESLTDEQRLSAAITRVSDEVHAGSKNRPGRVGSGSTVVAALIKGSTCVIGNLGDSRAYLLRDGKLTCLTTDHTLAQILYDAGQVTTGEIPRHPARNTLSRFVGMTPPGRPDVASHVLQASDRLLLCSDGISGQLKAETLESLVAEPKSPKSLSTMLVNAANDAGGRDNMTAVVLDATNLGETIQLQARRS